MLIGTLIFARVLQACEVKSVSHAILTREATEDCLIIQVIFANVSLISGRTNPNLFRYSHPRPLELWKADTH